MSIICSAVFRNHVKRLFIDPAVAERRARERVAAAPALAEQKERLSFGVSLAFARAGAEPDIGNADRAVNIVLMRQSRRAIVVGNVLELAQLIWRNGSPRLVSRLTVNRPIIKYFNLNRG